MTTNALTAHHITGEGLKSLEGVCGQTNRHFRLFDPCSIQSWVFFPVNLQSINFESLKFAFIKRAIVKM